MGYDRCLNKAYVNCYTSKALTSAVISRRCINSPQIIDLGSFSRLVRHPDTPECRSNLVNFHPRPRRHHTVDVPPNSQSVPGKVRGHQSLANYVTTVVIGARRHANSLVHLFKTKRTQTQTYNQSNNSIQVDSLLDCESHEFPSSIPNCCPQRTPRSQSINEMTC
jgi:hypothetical protein